MYVVKPTNLIGKVFSSTATELYPAWVSGRSYAADDVVSVLDGSEPYMQTRLTQTFATALMKFVVELPEPFVGCYAFLQTLSGGQMLADVGGDGLIQLTDAITCLNSITGQPIIEAQYAWIYGTLIPAIQAKVVIDPTNYSPFLQVVPVGVAYGKRYQCIVAGAGTLPPGLDDVNWTLIGPTNTEAMFDREISTATTATDTLTVVIAPGYANAISLFGLVGTELRITVRNGLAGPIVYGNAGLNGPAVISLADASLVQNAFEAPLQRDSYSVSNLPAYADAHITITLVGTGTVACGVLDVGVAYDIGGAQQGASLEITDYSRKTTDDFGAVTFVKRSFAKRLNVTTEIDNADLRRVTSVISGLRGTPCTWVATDEATLEPLNVFGWFEGVSVAVPYPTTSLVTLTVQGLAQ